GHRSLAPTLIGQRTGLHDRRVHYFFVHATSDRQPPHLVALRSRELLLPPTQPGQLSMRVEVRRMPVGCTPCLKALSGHDASPATGCPCWSRSRGCTTSRGCVSPRSQRGCTSPSRGSRGS